MPETITSLIEKLEQAEVGSRELDAAIADLLLDPIFKPLSKTRQMRWPFVEGSGIAALTPPVTISLDAALALAERLELSVGEILNDALEGPAGVGIWQSGWNGTVSTIPQIARFVCIAILRAQSEAR